LRDRYQVHRQPADVITSLAFLAPDRLFGQIRHNLRPGEPEE
jgi:hypothetical protein